MLTAQGRTANALGGKTARACDSCLRKRARWFCAADDAFLCQSCDSSVHSANQLASRHERVRIETSSSSSFNFRSTESKLHDQISDPVWHHGFTRKARTPRHHQKPPVLKKDNNNNIVNSLNSSLPLVPEIGVEENNSPDENDDEQFLYRVPVFDPLFFGGGGDSNNEIESFLNDEFIDSDAKLAELAADVENLLGSTTELDEDLAAAGVVSNNFIASDFMNNNRVKIEEDDDDDEDEEVQAVIASHFDPALDSARESLSWDFDYSSSSPVIGGDEDLETKMMIELPENEFETKPEGMRKIFLKLNYDDIINTWDSQNCPWTNGTRPDFNCHDFVGNGCGTFEQAYGVGAGAAAGGGGRDEEREARVLRYKEKRRTRLFSKKIRYEVRKLNAEKRPRMKGRFVKRTSLLPGSSSSSSNNFPNYLINK